MTSSNSKPLSRRAKDRHTRIMSSLESVDKNIAMIKSEDIEELVRRDMISIDTYANSHTGGSIVAYNRGGSPELTPVERAAESAMKDRQPRDYVRERIKEIEKWTFQMENLARQIKDSVNALMSGVEKKKARQATEPCEICQVLPAVKTAMCAPCREEWIDAGSPDRARWRMYCLSLRSSEGKILVTDQPPARR